MVLNSLFGNSNLNGIAESHFNACAVISHDDTFLLVYIIIFTGRIYVTGERNSCKEAFSDSIISCGRNVFHNPLVMA